MRKYKDIKVNLSFVFIFLQAHNSKTMPESGCGTSAKESDENSESMHENKQQQQSTKKDGASAGSVWTQKAIERAAQANASAVIVKTYSKSRVL